MSVGQVGDRGTAQDPLNEGLTHTHVGKVEKRPTLNHSGEDTHGDKGGSLTKERGTQTADGGEGPRRGCSFRHQWVSERYTVREKYLRKICTHWGVTPTVDAFADEGNKRLRIWWGPGSPFGTDAFEQSWGAHFLWMNPPYSRLPEVVDKIKSDQAHGVLVVPNWRQRRWYKRAESIRLADLWFPTGTKVFELKGKACKGTLWPTRAILVCGHEPKCSAGGYASTTIERDRRKVRFAPKPTFFSSTMRELKPFVATATPTKAALKATPTPTATQGANTLATSTPTPTTATPTQGPSLEVGSHHMATATESAATRGVASTKAASFGGSSSTSKGEPLRMLDLFSGTGSVGRVYAENGFEVTTVDMNPKWQPHFVVDVLTWDYKGEFKPHHFHTVVCGVPCTEFSTAKTTGVRDLDLADRLAKKALEIVEYLKPQRWWLENPRHGLLTTRPYMNGIPFVDADYCQYSDWGYQKPTRIWGSPDLLELRPKPCNGVTCPNLDHRAGRQKNGRPKVRLPHRIRLSSKHQNLPPAMKYRIPEALVRELAGFSPISSSCVCTQGACCQSRETLEGGHTATVTIPHRLLGEPQEYQVGTIKKTHDGKRQLMLDVRARCSDGRKLVLRVLIDTGAEANLIRKGLLAPELMKTSLKPLTLVTADGSPMEGGTCEVTLQLCFASSQPNAAGKPEWCTRGTFHEADIKVDAILSSPWLDSERLGVFPHLDALARVDPQDPTHLKLLRDWPTRKGGGKPCQRVAIRGVSGASQRHSSQQPNWRHDPDHSEGFMGDVARVRAMNLSLPPGRRGKGGTCWQKTMPPWSLWPDGSVMGSTPLAGPTVLCWCRRVWGE